MNENVKRSRYFNSRVGKDKNIKSSKDNSYFKENKELPYIGLGGIKSKFHKNSIKALRKTELESIEITKLHKNYNIETPGIIEKNECDDKEIINLSQNDISKSVDIITGQKKFDLHLNQFGPYRIKYARNGRMLLLGGYRGHVASVDWQNKYVNTEINVMENIHDISWLQNEKLFAIAQDRWSYIYDNSGIEVHCLKKWFRMNRLLFLPYHFLLVGCNSTSNLKFMDISLGQEVCDHNTKLGKLMVMEQNPQNAVIYLGHQKGVVSLWTPNNKEAVTRVLCHGTTIRDISIDISGKYMATTASDYYVKIWDLRHTYKELGKLKVPSTNSISFSQTNMLAVSSSKTVLIYNNVESQVNLYLKSKLPNHINQLRFCPYEDILGVGHDGGFSSLIIPGSAIADIDTYEDNPFETKKQRNEKEIHMLIDKIQPEFINVDSTILSTLRRQTDENKMKNKMQQSGAVSYQNKIDVKLRNRKKGANKASKIIKRKQGVREEISKKKFKKPPQKLNQDSTEPFNVLKRFE
ncbi:WD repeat-containing protein 46 [Intoshia linei]|uniref:WD repeat-containing protein 46 n=1 Tax=Intoshia linei TaxID=1819745 RepID=A0A177B915_9BILA|nr:WD repeat-containing protein 46 [Intoshia linei]